jgi:two-component system, cell cycle sensor histidine kinase and response regulator CckA
MFAPLINETVDFETDLSDDLGTVTADPGQIEQVIMNLVVNARDAMPNGGTLRVTTANVTLAEDAAERGSDTAPGDYVVLSVTDSGHGMDAETTARIFEPFFTTKERGAGTGLGLATVYGIAKQFGGDIEAESEPGVGTTFRLYFPRVSATAEPFSAQPVDDGRPLNGVETVLLVEDEEALRSIGKEILEAYGYTVILAGDGVEALEVAQNGAGSIQLLMTDILMPRMGGIELAEQLSALHPDLKILYTSGYNDSGAGLRGVPGSRYLQKPYAMQELGRTLRELLDPV